jgi:Xaa-Pro aminopeptidase
VSDNAVFAERLKALSAALAAAPPDRRPLDALLISGLPNIRYLSGFTGSNALLLVAGGSATLLTDPRYTLQAAKQSPFPARIGKGPLVSLAADLVKRRKFKRLGVERNRISFETWAALESALPAGCKMVPVTNAVEDLRMVKSAEETALIRDSVETNSRAFRRAMKGFRAGMRENELAAEIDYQARRAGAESPAFETIVAAGERSAFPHARPTGEKIGSKTMLLIDMGSFQAGYASDMTRTLFVGKASKRFKQAYRAVLEAQLAAIDRVRPGVTSGEVDSAARSALTKAGHGAAFVHSTGHGLGLEIHEQPRIGDKGTVALQAGFVITIEPGVYFEGWGGIRIEDTVVVTETGCEVLTPTPKDLVEW